jgi:hypothetical protein
MAEWVDAAILETAHAATRIRFDAEKVTKDRLRLATRLKGGGVKITVDLRNPTFMGPILDVLSRCIDRTGPNGEKTRGIYSDTLTTAIGDGAYDQEGHMNAGFLQATAAGPYPKAMHHAWQFARLDCAHNCGLTLESPAEEWGRLGPLAAETPANVRNRGAMERKQRGRMAMEATMGINEEEEGGLTTQDLAGVMAKVINELEAGETEVAVASTTSADDDAGTNAIERYARLQRGPLRGLAYIVDTTGASEAIRTTR